MARMNNCPHCGGVLDGADDGRAEWWRMRVRLYDHHHSMDEPMRGADSDGDLEPDAPGRTLVRGVRQIVSEAAEAATTWHGETLRGMGGDVLDQKARGIRSTLYRNGGRATIRIPYDTVDSFSDHRDHRPRYLARVDFEKAAAPDGNNGGTT